MECQVGFDHQHASRVAPQRVYHTARAVWNPRPTRLESCVFGRFLGECSKPTRKTTQDNGTNWAVIKKFVGMCEKWEGLILAFGLGSWVCDQEIFGRKVWFSPGMNRFFSWVVLRDIFQIFFPLKLERAVIVIFRVSPSNWQQKHVQVSYLINGFGSVPARELRIELGWTRIAHGSKIKSLDLLFFTGCAMVNHHKNHHHLGEYVWFTFSIRIVWPSKSKGAGTQADLFITSYWKPQLPFPSPRTLDPKKLVKQIFLVFVGEIFYSCYLEDHPSRVVPLRGRKLTMVINHLLPGMTLQVIYQVLHWLISKKKNLKLSNIAVYKSLRCLWHMKLPHN